MYFGWVLAFVLLIADELDVFQYELQQLQQCCCPLAHGQPHPGIFVLKNLLKPQLPLELQLGCYLVHHSSMSRHYINTSFPMNVGPSSPYNFRKWIMLVLCLRKGATG